MRILIVGSGGREHTLAWKLAQSPHAEQIFVAPGNGGTAAIARNVPLAATDIPALVDFARQERIDLTVVGPEAPLVAGLVDALVTAGLRAIGPSAAAAQLEGSKAFAKRFMIEEGIPTALGAIFDDYEAARAYLRRQDAPLVVKASGLAAGKGVFVCATLAEAEEALHRVMVDRAFGPAGDEVVIEDCLAGEEASLLAFSDGRTVAPMLPARDYKRVGEGDVGPNTGGMGCYAPSPYLPPELVQEAVARVLQPAVDGMRRRGAPYVGVLYAGLMLTEHGPRVLEFNCRFGDPETQVILPLLDSDLVEIFLACLEGRLAGEVVDWKTGQAVTVVMASGGYPGGYEKGKEITGLEVVEDLDDVVVFQAGTRRQGDRLLTAGGRVLTVTATAPSRETARALAYAAVERIRFKGAFYRSDIALHIPLSSQPHRSGVVSPSKINPCSARTTVRAFAPDCDPARAGEISARAGQPRPGGAPGDMLTPPKGKGNAYAAAGVDIEAGNRAVELMKEALRSTYTPAVLADVGLFGGLFALKEAVSAQAPVLVASTDSVGTKTMIAAALGRYDTIGRDLVNHCVNDILVQGARPLFFLDYFASSKLDPEQVAVAVGGCAAACRAVGCALIGGETAELPGVYRPGEFDLVGAIVGWVERERIVDGRDVKPGDICLGLSSSGLHTNGYSLARRALADLSWDTVLPELGRPLGEALLTPHRAYLREVEALWAAGVSIKAMAHITGGGFPDNIPRVLPEGVGVEIDRSAWEAPPLFRLIQQRGGVDEAEMFRVFNMGIGLVLIVAPEEVERALAALPEAVVIGSATANGEQNKRAGEQIRSCLHSL